MIGLVILLVLALLIVLGTPISMALGGATMVGLLGSGYHLSTLPNLVTNGASNYTLVAIPYFVLLGYVMNSGGITRRIFDFADALVGHIKGGLAQVNVLASVIFAGISGTASADAAGLGLIEIDAMTKSGYDRAFSAGITAASAVLGPIIPPSVTFLIFATLTNASVAELFMAGIIPGVIIAAVLMIANYLFYTSGKVKMPAPVPFSWHRLWQTFKDGFFALMCPVVLVVTMTVGFVTPTEAGIVGLVYSIIVGIIYKEITIKSFLEACQQTVITCALIMFLMGLGSAVGWLLTAENVPRQLSNAMLSVTDNKYVILLFINVILLILGMFMDGTTIQLIMVPLLMPIMSALNVSLLQFGVMVTINIMIGTITPPFGTGLFITATVAGVKMENLIKYCLIFMAPLLVGLLLITYVPFFTTWLPGILFA